MFVEQEQIRPDPNFALHQSGVHSVVNCVFSAQAKFESVVLPVLARLDERLVDTPELTFRQFVDDVDSLGHERYAAEVLNNRQRLSRRLKVEVCYDVASFFVERGYETQGDFQLPANPDTDMAKAKQAKLEQLILVDLVTEIRGIGSVLAQYLMWLLGDERHVKPDTVLTRLLSRVGEHPLRLGHPDDMALIRQSISAVAVDIGTTPARLDNALWRYESTGGRTR